jgi:starch-binding outer membrane protein, SusD/RagB family
MTSLLRTAMRALAPAALLLATAGCNDVVDLTETPQTFLSPETFFNSDANIDVALNGMYAPLSNTWGWNTEYATWCDDNEMSCWNWMGGGFRGLLNASPEGSATYEADYRVIGRANTLLAALPQAQGVTDAKKKQAAAEARFVRGYAYFDLARRYGSVPLRLEAYTPDPTLGDLARAPLPEVYAAIVADLKAAADNLPASYGGPNGGIKPTKAAALGLLAKVYLEMAGAQLDSTSLRAQKAQNNQLARDAAAAAMDAATAGGIALNADYMKAFDTRTQDNDAEILFAIQMLNRPNMSAPVGQYFTPLGDARVAGLGQGFLLFRQDFLNTFEAGDKRVEHNKAISWSWTQQNNAYGARTVIVEDSLSALMAAGIVKDTVPLKQDGWAEGCASFMHPTKRVVYANGRADTLGISKPIYTLKYLDPSSAGGSQNTNNILVLRYADVLLVRAEAENEVSGPAAALPFIDMVRRRAGLPSLAVANPAAASDKAAFRRAVWQERAHELYAEFQAVFDLKREWSADGKPRWLEAMNATSTETTRRGYWGSDYSSHGACRPRAGYQLWQPLPQSEISANQLVKQNTGW